MKQKTQIPILLAIVALVSAGYYVAGARPEAALSATWNPPAATGCFVPAEAYLIDWQTVDGRVGRDSTFAAVWNDYPPGIFRFRTAAYSFVRDGAGNVVDWRIGRPLSGDGCAVVAAETLWSAWSGWGNNGAPGQPGVPVFGAVIK